MAKKPKKQTRRAFGGVYERFIGGKSVGWYVRWSVAGRRYHRRGGRTKALAEGMLARLSLEHARDLLEGRGNVAPVTLAQFATRLWAVWEVSLRPDTIVGRRYVITWAANHFQQPMREVTQPEAEALLLGAIRDGSAISTTEARRAVLRAAWALAERMGIVRTNPWRHIRLPKADREPDRVLTPAELEKLYAAAVDPRLRLAVVLLGETGMRRGEVVGLTWRDVAADRRSVTIRGAVAKSHRFRVVPLSERAKAEVERAWRERPGVPDARPVGWGDVQFGKEFRRLADACGMPDVTAHCLRHTVGHALGDSGAVSTLALRDLLGHSTIRMTERYMGRASRKAVEDAVQALERLRHAETLRASSSASRSEPRT